MNYETILCEIEDGIGTITLNRPKVLNAINDELLKEMSEALDIFAENQNVKVVILTGGDKVFAAGADIVFMSEASSLEAESFVRLCHETIDKITNLDKPVIAAIAGLALGGGCELTLSCDIRIAAEGTNIGLPEINLGLYPGGGGTQRLTRLVGTGWAKQLLMTGKPIDAKSALNIGLVTKVVPAQELMKEAKGLALELARKSTIAMRLMKSCIDYGENVDLPSGCLFEQKVWALLLSTDDAHEGMKAFLEKRKPDFRGR
ncbi:MAG: enoyl-CoA hydratase/isomerase family protein [Syntrophomonadaceae bacterium]|nr:enoyl-CoA hydratase/isomerase family protein [Syntrophomonadaceae bacterium]